MMRVLPCWLRQADNVVWSLPERDMEIKIAVAGFVVLVVLKVVGWIAWSWWWVTAPLWGTGVLFVVGYAILFYLDRQGVR